MDLILTKWQCAEDSIIEKMISCCFWVYWSVNIRKSINSHWLSLFLTVIASSIQWLFPLRVLLLSVGVGSWHDRTSSLLDERQTLMVKSPKDRTTNHIPFIKELSLSPEWQVCGYPEAFKWPPAPRSLLGRLDRCRSLGVCGGVTGGKEKYGWSF